MIKDLEERILELVCWLINSRCNQVIEQGDQM